jgi:hypothetical protein
MKTIRPQIIFIRGRIEIKPREMILKPCMFSSLFQHFFLYTDILTD